MPFLLCCWRFLRRFTKKNLEIRMMMITVLPIPPAVAAVEEDRPVDHLLEYAPHVVERRRKLVHTAAVLEASDQAAHSATLAKVKVRKPATTVNVSYIVRYIFCNLQDCAED
jgi:hypothetical protein